MCAGKSSNNFVCKYYTIEREVGILLTKTTATQNEVALSYHKMRGLYFLAVVFVRSIVLALLEMLEYLKHCAHFLYTMRGSTKEADLFDSSAMRITIIWLKTIVITAHNDDQVQQTLFLTICTLKYISTDCECSEYLLVNKVIEWQIVI